MVQLNIGARNSDNNYDAGGNISIKHQAGIHKAHGAASKDILSESTSTHQEEYVPPAEYPQLPQFDPNASDKPQARSPDSPNGRFSNHLQSNINSMSDAQFAKMQQGHPGLTRQEAQNMLKFAWNHPNANTDAATKEVLKEMVNQATSETKEDLGLPNKWTPSGPDTALANQEIAEHYNDNFEELANKTGKDANALIFAHYNPQYADKLNPQLKSQLNSLEQQAAEETRQEDGIPKNFDIPRNSAAFNAKLGSQYYENFNELLGNKLLKGEINQKELAELRTLHFAPNADVPDKSKLLPMLKNMNAEAFNLLKKQFELPEHFKLKSSNADYKNMLKSEFNESFADNVKSYNPPLTDAQKQLLLASKGMSKSNLPPELKLVFDNIKNKTVADMQEMFGLPKDWDPQSNQLEVGEGKDTVTEEETAGTSPEAEAAWSGVQGSKANPKVQGKRLSANRVNLQDLTAVAPRDNKLSRQLLNHSQEMVGHISDFGNKYLSGPDAIMLGDAMLIVSLALSNLRKQVYDVQTVESKLASRNSEAQKDGQINKIKQQHDEQVKQRDDQKKVFFLFKIFDALGLNFLTQQFKMNVWLLDTLTGGVISMITKAAGVQPITENPLLAVGWISKEQAEKMDFALQIIVMVAEMVVSIIFAQPQLVMGLVAKMAGSIAEVAGKVVAQVAMQAAKEVLKEAAVVGLREGVQVGVSVGSRAATEAAQAAARKAVEEALKKITEKLIAKGVDGITRKAIEKTLQKMMPQIIKGAVKEAGKEVIKEAATEGLKAATREATHAALSQVSQNILREGLEEVAKASTKTFEKGIKGFAKTALDIAKSEVTDLKDFVKGGDFAAKMGREAGTGAAKSVGGSAMKYAKWITMAHEIINTSLGAASNVVQGVQHINQAKLRLLLAELESNIEESDTDLKILQKAMKALQTGMVDMASWVNDINKQQSQYWQKMQVHYVAA